SDATTAGYASWPSERAKRASGTGTGERVDAAGGRGLDRRSRRRIGPGGAALRRQPARPGGAGRDRRDGLPRGANRTGTGATPGVARRRGATRSAAVRGGTRRTGPLLLRRAVRSRRFPAQAASPRRNSERSPIQSEIARLPVCRNTVPIG